MLAPAQACPPAGCATTVRAAEGRLSAPRVLRRKSVLYGGFVWARRALNRRNWRFPAPRAAACSVHSLLSQKVTSPRSTILNGCPGSSPSSRRGSTACPPSPPRCGGRSRGRVRHYAPTFICTCSITAMIVCIFACVRWRWALNDRPAPGQAAALAAAAHHRPREQRGGRG